MVAEGRLRPAVFIDRDGVINEERNYVHQISEFAFLPGAIEGLKKLQDLGYALVVVTNQAGIAKGFYTEADFERLTNHMLQKLLKDGVKISGVYHCPHHPNGVVTKFTVFCECRKPRPGMLLRAANDLGVLMEKSILVGDKISDIEAGFAAGITTNILVESGHEIEEASKDVATVVCKNLDDAAEWIAINFPKNVMPS